jgi:hypothetical protein
VPAGCGEDDRGDREAGQQEDQREAHSAPVPVAAKG